MSRYVTLRGSSWLLAPFASPRALSGTRPRPPPARDPGSKKTTELAARDRHHGAEEPPGSRFLLLLQLHGSEVISVSVEIDHLQHLAGSSRAPACVCVDG